MLFVTRKSVVLYMKFYVVIVTLFMLGKPDAVQALEKKEHVNAVKEMNLVRFMSAYCSL